MERTLEKRWSHRRPDQQAIMIVHQDVAVNLPAEPLRQFGHQSEELASFSLVDLPPSAPVEFCPVALAPLPIA